MSKVRSLPGSLDLRLAKHDQGGQKAHAVVHPDDLSRVQNVVAGAVVETAE